MVDAIIEYIRTAKTGVSSVELAERFLKFKNPPVKFAQTAISGIIATDKRCLLNDAGFWEYDESGDSIEIALDKLPLCIVYIQPDSRNEKINYLSIWNIFPIPECCCDVWLHTPSSTTTGSVDLSGIDFDEGRIGNRLAQVVSILSEKIPVLFSDEDLHLFNAQFENDVLTDKKKVILFSDLLGALSIDIPEDYVLSEVSKIFNNNQFPVLPREQAGFFASTVFRMLKMVNEENIFTKKEFDRVVLLKTEQMIAGKQFSLQQIESLPEAPGVYGLKDIGGKYLFISKCKDLQQSIRGHFRKYSNPGKRQIAEETVCFDAHRCGSELECELFEYRLIKKYNPRFMGKKTIISSELPGNCILFLPHSELSKVLTIWVCAKRKVVMKSFRSDIEIPLTVDTELYDFFYTLPDTDLSDPYERSIIGDYCKKNPDIQQLVLPSSLSTADLLKDFKERIMNFVEN